MSGSSASEGQDATDREPASPVRHDVSGVVYGPSVQAGTVHGSVHIHASGKESFLVPAQLLPPPAHFTNRAEELDGLGRVLDESGIVVVTGTGGIGKTSLVLHWLHQNRDRFPDGQLYVDLRGLSAPEPVSPVEVLGRFLRALGTDPDRVPTESEEAAAAFRSLTAERRIVVLADNALSAAQARQLRPGPASRLIVTSRYRLTGLAMDGARFLELGPFSEWDAMELLDRTLGKDRVQPEPEAVRSLVHLCGRMPIAVCGSAARLATRPRWRLERFVAELDDEHRRLALLSVDDDISIRAVFDLSSRALPQRAARMYRLLSLHPGADFGSGAAAATAGLDREATERLLGELIAANLLEEVDDDRYRFHDLIRLHARRQADDQESDAERRAAVERIVDWYLQSAAAADLIALPGRWRLNELYDRLREQPPAFDNPADALDWLEDQLSNLVAVLETAYAHGLHERVWQLCEAMWSLFQQRKPLGDAWMRTHRLGIDSARSCSAPQAEARIRVQLASLYRHLRRYDDAAEQLTTALALDRTVGHRLGEAAALENLGLVALDLSRTDEALRSFRAALEIHEQLNRTRGIAMMTYHLGETLGAAGRLGEAIEHLRRAYDLFVTASDPFHQARVLMAVGSTYLRAGRPDEAVAPLRRALEVVRELGLRYDQGNVHEVLAEAARQSGDPVEFRAELRRALAAYSDVRAPQAEEVQARLDAAG
ncbi:MAG: tetratricopeptide repeat protein [Streptosporangiales bacterium]|nr:tetratricopeptide repeat protein [Streptosporangiales bacterium]